MIGAGYYNTGTVLVTPSTRVMFYNNQSAAVEDIDLGDCVEITATTGGMAVWVTIVTP
jgi:hypothetical protein